MKSTDALKKIRYKEVAMSRNGCERILVADDNHIFRETLAHRLRGAGYQVITAETGERAFLTLRDWAHPVDWLYTRAKLPGLVDGWILADEYHDSRPARAVIIAALETRTSRQGDIVLNQPALTTVLDVLQHSIELECSKLAEAQNDASGQRRAA
jgi:CheY-like chemotaxis protein